MAAPTPVSALVHSRTLVTAGIIIIYRFYDILQPRERMLILCIIATLTILFSSIIGTVELDFKKIVALSTLRQVRLIIFSLRFNIKAIRFFHLRTHAFYKRLLFLRVGVIIHQMWSQQNLKRYSSFNNKWLNPMVVTSVLGLCGGVFLSGFYSKDIILEKLFISKYSLFFLGVVYFIIVTTVIYSFRIIFRITNMSKLIVFNETVKITSITPLLILSIISLVTGLIIMWNFNPLYVIFMSVVRKVWVLFILLFGLCLFILFSNLFYPLFYNVVLRIIILTPIRVMIRFITPVIKFGLKILEKGWINLFVTVTRNKLTLMFITINQIERISRLSYLLFITWLIRVTVIF